MATDITNDVQITQISGSLSRGGWQCRFIALNDTDLCDKHQNVIIQWRPYTTSGFSDPRLAFKGYVVPIQFSFTHDVSTTEFNAETSDGFLRLGWLQGIGFADLGADGRTHYHQFDNVTGAPAQERMTMGRIVRHIMGYYDELGAPPGTNPDWVAHTNMVYHPTQNPHGWITLDGVETEPFDVVTNPDGTMRVDRFIVRETSNLWSKLREIAHNEFFEIWFDKTDKMHYAKHPMYQTTLPLPVMTFDEEFSIIPPTVTVRDTQQVRQVNIYAVTDEGDTYTPDDEGTCYPASPTHVYGNVIDINHVRCNDANTAIDWAERRYKYENRPYTVKWTAPGLCGLYFDILDRVQVTYTGTSANGVHIDWEEEKFWVHDIIVTPDASGGGTTQFTLEAENL